MDHTFTSHLPTAKVTFTAEEKELLVSLLKSEKIIEDKRTNKSTNKLKAEAWDRITKRYNNHAFVTKREAIQLRRCWEKIKRLTKDARSKEKISRMATGGGSPSLPNLDYVPGVDEVVPHLMYEIPNTVDSDTFFKTERQTGTYKTQSALHHRIPNLDVQNSENSNIKINISSRTSSPLQENMLAAANVVIVTSQASPPAISDMSIIEPGREERHELAGTDTNTISGRDGYISDTTPVLPSARSSLQNRNLSARRRLASTTVSDVVSMRHINILKERQQQQELYLLRHSLLEMEKEQISENIRHQIEINKVREIMETEKLEHQRALQKIEVELACLKLK